MSPSWWPQRARGSAAGAPSQPPNMMVVSAATHIVWGHVDNATEEKAPALKWWHLITLLLIAGDVAILLVIAEPLLATPIARSLKLTVEVIAGISVATSAERFKMLARHPSALVISALVLAVLIPSQLSDIALPVRRHASATVRVDGQIRTTGGTNGHLQIRGIDEHKIAIREGDTIHGFIYDSLTLTRKDVASGFLASAWPFRGFVKSDT